MPFLLEPLGFGTADLEALTSLFCRAADRHWLLTIPFWNSLVSGSERVYRGKRHTGKRTALKSMNGLGRFALRVSDLFDIAAGNNAKRLTFLPWREILDPVGHGLLKPDLAWCPLCWREDVETGTPGYVRLVWLARPVVACAKHCVQLRAVCTKCKKPQPVLPRIPRQTICNWCGTDLVDVDYRRLRTADPHGKDIWVSSAVGELLRHTWATAKDIPADSFQGALNALAAQYCGGSLETLADCCGMSRRMIRQWASGLTKPALTGLVEFAYRVQIPLAALLLKHVGMTDPSFWRRDERPVFVKKHRKLSSRELRELHARLIAAINARKEATPSLRGLAKQCGVTYLVLLYHFPAECRRLQRKVRANMAECIKARQAKRMEQLVRAARELSSKGIYPSRRALRARFGFHPSDLRRPEINQQWKKICSNFLIGNYDRKRRTQRAGNARP